MQTINKENEIATQYSHLKDDSLWFKDAIIYEVPVKAFADSNGDGIGDFPGLTSKLDYLKDLGVTAIWLLPFFPSPLRDDGYDIADYRNVNPIYGTLKDFQELLDAAHERGIRVIIELIVNHTSDQHPWFQRARKAPLGSKERDFYVWSDTSDKYPDVRVIFQDFETSNWAWDSVAKSYYWHRFYSHQPDLNYESPDVQQAVLDVVDFWFDMGVDGMRLDAVPYLCVAEGTNCENLPETHAFLKRLRAHVDAKYSNRMLLAEANQWPEDAAAYFGAGDECHMNFHFPLMPRLFMSLRMEDSFPIADILQQTPLIPSNCQWALFLRNHDELTLEMVSDEDRDYMYRVYTKDLQARINLGIRHRLAPLLGNNRREIELMNALLLSMPGTPVIYYGDEIGMGDNIFLGDRNGVRTPMQWSSDRNAGFSRTNPHRLYLPTIVDSEYHYEAVNVEAQQGNLNSLWWWTKRLLAIRSRFKAFGRGTFELLYPDNRKVLAFIRSYDGEHILVVANLSRFSQTVELDLSSLQGMVPVEIFGRVKFPQIKESEYFLSLNAHSFYWFSLQPQDNFSQLPQPLGQLPTLRVTGKWQNAFVQKTTKAALESHLSVYLHSCSWYKGKNRTIQSINIFEVIPITYKEKEAAIILVQVEYTEDSPEIYVLPLSYGADPGEGEICQLQTTQEKGFLFDALADKEFLNFPLEAIASGQTYQGISGNLVATPTEVFGKLSSTAIHIEPRLFRGPQDNSSIIYGSSFILKLYRRVDVGTNPDWELGRFLTQKGTNNYFAQVAGAIEYDPKGSDSITIGTIGVLQGYIPDTVDAWSYTLDNLRSYFEQVMVKQFDSQQMNFPALTMKALSAQVIPEFAYEVIGSYLSSAELLGQRTADVHMTLASDLENPAFAPEAFTSFYQRSIYQYCRNLAGKALLELQKELPQLPNSTQKLAQIVLNNQKQILERFRLVIKYKINATRIRSHGKYHLGQVLYTGKDFVIIDFKGETNRPLSERRMKRSPLRDVAGMLLSFNYAANIALRRELENGMIRPENLPLMEQWTQFWSGWIGITFLKAYMATATESSFLPKTDPEFQVLLEAYLLEKAMQELNWQLSQKNLDWLEINLNWIIQSLGVNLASD